MALLDYVDPAETSPAVRELLEVETSDRRSLLRPMLANHPPLLEAQLAYHERLMLEGNVERELKELVGVVVSQANDCDYCASSHREKLHTLGLSAEALDAVGRSAYDELTERERAAVSFAERAATDPHRLDAADVDALRAAGFDDQDVLEVLGVVAMFQAANTLANALSIHPTDADVGLEAYLEPSSLEE